MKNDSHPFFSPKCVESQRKKAKKKAASKQSWKTPWGDETLAGVTPVQWCDSLWCLLFRAGTFTSFSFCPKEGRAEIIITKGQGHTKSSLWDMDPSLAQGCLCRPTERLDPAQAGLWGGSVLISPVFSSSCRNEALPKCVLTSTTEIPALPNCQVFQAAPAPCPPPHSDRSGEKADFWVQSDTRPA